MRMPDGVDFEFWDDLTVYRRVFHVSALHPHAADDNPGTPERPFRTISRVAVLLQPGEKAVIHEGVYRERVTPARGGRGADAMIAYESAPGERVVLRGSERWDPSLARFRVTDSVRHQRPLEGGVMIWMGDLPEALFRGYNPFLINNTSEVMLLYGHQWTPAEMKRYLLKRGMLLCGGRPLEQVQSESELLAAPGRFWVDALGHALHFRLPQDEDPAAADLELTSREQVFSPQERGLGHIRISGLVVEHAADPMTLTTLQHGALSTGAGHHWIIEDCTVRYCNATGIDVGLQEHARLAPPQERGHHVIRRNRISDCGITGLCGLGNPEDTLVEGNRFERIGGLLIERMFECAGLKFHGCRRVLIRGNVFRHLRQACGIWLDYHCGMNRVTGNVFQDIDSIFGGVHVESSFDPHWIDGNVFWDMKSWRAADYPPESPMRGGHGVFADSCDFVTVAHNFFGPTASYAVACHFKQADRVVFGRVGLNRGHRVLNNVFGRCAKRVLFGRREDNVCDGNVYDQTGDAGSLCLYRPEPAAILNLETWRDYAALDRHSGQTGVSAEVDSSGDSLMFRRGPSEVRPVPVPEGMDYEAPGPFSAAVWDAAESAGHPALHPLGSGRKPV